MGGKKVETMKAESLKKCEYEWNTVDVESRAGKESQSVSLPRPIFQDGRILAIFKY
jgi:hypothetical protein